MDEDREEGRHDMVHVLGRAVAVGDLTAARRAVAILEAQGVEPTIRQVEARRRALASMAAEGDLAAANALVADLASSPSDAALMAEVVIPRAPGVRPGAFVVRRMAAGAGRVEFVVSWRDEGGDYGPGAYWPTYAEAMRDLASRVDRWADR